MLGLVRMRGGIRSTWSRCKGGRGRSRVFLLLLRGIKQSSFMKAGKRATPIQMGNSLEKSSVANA